MYRDVQQRSLLAEAMSHINQLSGTFGQTQSSTADQGAKKASVEQTIQTFISCCPDAVARGYRAQNRQTANGSTAYGQRCTRTWYLDSGKPSHVLQEPGVAMASLPATCTYYTPLSLPRHLRVLEVMTFTNQALRKNVSLPLSPPCHGCCLLLPQGLRPFPRCLDAYMCQNVPTRGLGSGTNCPVPCPTILNGRRKPGAACTS